jgi:hypothetical protein
MSNDIFWIIKKCDNEEGDITPFKAYPVMREKLDEMKRVFDGDEIIIAQEGKL